MKIPTTFKLLGQTITVKIDNRSNPVRAGQSLFQKNQIVLYRKANKTRELLEQTFLHEVTHFIFLYVNTVDPVKIHDGTKLYNDERTVDLTAALFQQVLKSGKIVK